MARRDLQQATTVLQSTSTISLYLPLFAPGGTFNLISLAKSCPTTDMMQLSSSMGRPQRWFPSSSPKLSNNFWFLFLVLAQLFVGSLAALYPTKPVSGTIYKAGRSASLTWSDDGSSPTLDSLGRMKIDLYRGAGVGILGSSHIHLN